MGKEGAKSREGRQISVRCRWLANLSRCQKVKRPNLGMNPQWDSMACCCLICLGCLGLTGVDSPPAFHESMSLYAMHWCESIRTTWSYKAKWWSRCGLVPVGNVLWLVVEMTAAGAFSAAKITTAGVQGQLWHSGNGPRYSQMFTDAITLKSEILIARDALLVRHLVWGSYVRWWCISCIWWAFGWAEGLGMKEAVAGVHKNHCLRRWSPNY